MYDPYRALLNPDMDSGHSDALPDDYYVANFHALALFVSNTYADLLNTTERSWYRSLQACSTPAQRLYIRLVTRKGSVFRLTKLRYPEISDLPMAAAELAAVGLASIEAPESLHSLTQSFTKPELVRLLGLTGIRSQSRVNIVRAVVECQEPQCGAYRTGLQQADRWITLLGHEHWTVFRLCFFGNLYQDGSEFVLRDMGTLEYERYDIDQSSRCFQSRVQLDAHLRYFECEALLGTVSMNDVDQLAELVAALPAPIMSDRALQRRLDRYRNRIARQFERLGETGRAMALYTRCIHPPARERQVRLNLSAGDMNAAQTVVDAMQDAPYNEAEAQVAERLDRQIAKINGVSLPVETRFRPATTRLTLAPSTVRVEQAARHFYARFGPCFYCENSLVGGVLGLFIWDIIFHPIPGVFFNPFQHAPADFYEPVFAERRQHLLADRFEELADPLRFSTRVMHNFDTHAGKANPLVHWGQLPVELLSLALQRVPSAHWLAMFSRLLLDPRENASGFPDLVLFRDQEGYEFIEVKGPGDVVQPNQRRWMRYFDQHRIACRVVNIKWAASTNVDELSDQ